MASAFRRIIGVGLAFVFCLAFVAAMAEAKEDKITLRISHTGAEGSEYYKGYQKFKEILEKKTNGKVKVRIYPNAVLGSDRVAGEAVQQGNLEAASIATNILASFDKSVLPFTMPYVVDPDKMIPFMEAISYGDLNKYLVDKMAASDFFPFLFNACAMRGWAFTKNDVKDVDDMKGIKVRATPSPIDVSNCKAVGMNPTTLAFDAVYQALQQGVVDGELISFSNLHSLNRSDLLKYMYPSKHEFTVHIGMMNKKFFDSLDPEIQQAIMESAKEAQEWEWQELAKIEKAGREYCEANGVKINDLDDDQKKKLNERFQVVWEEYGPQLDPKMLELIRASQE